MKVLIAGLVGVLLLVVLAAGVVVRPGDDGGFERSHSVRVEEDSPLWDCETMGNLRCGEGVQ